MLSFLKPFRVDLYLINKQEAWEIFVERLRSVKDNF